MSSLKRIVLPIGFALVCLVLLVASLAAEVGAGNSADIILSFAEPSARTFEDRQLALAATQAQIINDANIEPSAIIHQYETLPLLALTVDAATLAQLQQNPAILSIEPDLPLQSHLPEAVPGTGAAYVHDTFAVKGTDVRVAVFDSGLQGNHSDFSISRTIAQRCFTDGDCFVEGSGFTANSSGSAEDNNGHGTNVTGIIASNGTKTIPGFAPEAKILSFRVLDRDAKGRLSDLVAGIDWLINNILNSTNDAVKPRLVNISLGVAPSQLTDSGVPTGLHNASCDTYSTAVDMAIDDLHSRGLILFASAGNDGSNSSITLPACHSKVIAVGASYDSNIGMQPSSSGTYSSTYGAGWGDCTDATTSATTVACFSNSNDQVDLIAPGAKIVASGLMSSTSMYAGTSQAAAVATGIAALMLDVDPTLTQAQLLHVMTRTATTVVDPKASNMTFPLINARAAVEAVLPKIYMPMVSGP